MKLALLLLFAVCLHSQELLHATAPKLIHTVEPEYTKDALDAKLQGEVILSIAIGEDGVPTEIKLVRGLGKGLDEKAIECARQWRFIPAKNYGEPVSSKATVVINFRLPWRPAQFMKSKWLKDESRR